jgi:UV DNA damage endonuclease
MLEEEWARYKYCILERSPEIYDNIRELLCDKTSYPALKMYRMIEAAFNVPIAAGNAVKAAQHVWGYLEDKASENEKKRFERLLKRFISGEANLKSVKSNLLLLAKEYDGNHLPGGYYFYF